MFLIEKNINGVNLQINMILLFIFIVFNIILIFGTYFLGKKNNDLYVLFIFNLFLCFATLGPTCDGLSNNETELKNFKNLYETTEYLIRSYNKNLDIEGDILVTIKENINHINNIIEQEQKGLNKILIKEFYVKEIAETEPIVFNYNNLIKEKNYE